MRDVYVEKFVEDSDRVILYYSDNSTVTVSKTDFNRAFGPIISAPKSDVIRDYAI